MEGEKIYVVRVLKSDNEHFVTRILGVYSSKNKAWNQINNLVDSKWLVFCRIDLYPDNAWSYSSACKAFKEYDKITVKLESDEAIEQAMHKYEIQIEACIIDE